MKLKIFAMLVLGLLIFSTVNVIGFEKEDKNNLNSLMSSHQISFSEPYIETIDEYCSVDVLEANSLVTSPGKPRLPVYKKVFTFPRGTKINDVEFTISEVKTETIETKIQPAPKPVPRTNINVNENLKITDKKIVEDKNIYSTSDLYPSAWCNYDIRCGLNNGKDTVFLIINCYPIRYSPLENKIYKINSFDVNVEYVKSTETDNFEEEFELLIIAPNEFVDYLQPLLVHKIDMGVSTNIITVESIYNESEGRDKPEQIKYAIKEAKEKWNITYVLLFGGLKSHLNATDKDNTNEGSSGWYVPVRYANINAVSENDHGYISDLYYSDIYKYNETSGENEFEDWDSNKNGIFLDGDWYGNEEVDLMPDVYYGRIPCRNVIEVVWAVNKIIRYEKPTLIGKILGKAWMKKMIAVGGVTTDGGEYYPDGEWLCDLSLDYMSNIIDKPVKIYASNTESGGPKPIARDIVREFRKGSGFCLFQGHGSAWIWDTHWPNTNGNWTGGITMFDFFRFSNYFMPPIVVVGGCHNGIFNVSLMPTMNEKTTKYYHSYGVPVRFCFSWKMVNKPLGGAIASTGCTSWGLAGSPPDTVSGGLEANFFYKIGTDGVDRLGQAHGGSIEKYMQEFDLDVNDVFCITEYELFGDPSLKIGGYNL